MGGNSITNIATNSLAFADGETISSEMVRNWNSAHGWGDHSASNYLTSFTELDPVYSGDPASSISDAGSGVVMSDDERTKLSGIETGADVTDAANVDAAGAVMTGDIGVDVQAQNDYLDDLADGSLSKSRVEDSANWDTAYGWGNHATNGYLTANTESDPVWAGVSNQYLKAASAASTYVAVSGDTMTGRLTLPANGLVVGSTQLVATNGYVGIGTSNPTNELAVNGTIKAREIIVSVDGWADYVFEKDYELMPLEQVERFIQQNGHLPDVPSAQQVDREGVEVGAMQSVLLRKIEELTLYIIELRKENEKLRRELSPSS
jgi:hypothetical protein